MVLRRLARQSALMVNSDYAERSGIVNVILRSMGPRLGIAAGGNLSTEKLVTCRSEIVSTNASSWI